MNRREDYGVSQNGGYLPVSPDRQALILVDQRRHPRHELMEAARVAGG